MDELVRWLGKQLDEDERIAKKAGMRSLQWRLARPLDDEEMGDASWLRPPELEHAERHDPARVLREVDAKRGVLRQYEAVREQVRNPVSAENRRAARIAQGELEDVLRLLAVPYSDRPGYDGAWRP